VSELALVSIALLWVVVIVLALAVFALSRQIGVLLERVAPAGALLTDKGLTPGETAPEVHARDLEGAAVRVGGARDDGRSTLVFFMSPTCPMCDAVLPAVRSLARNERAWLDVILASDGDEADHADYARRKSLAAFPYLVSRELGLRFRVGQLPHAALLDAQGIVVAAGLTNTREHLDSLLEAKRRGVSSIQEYMEQRRKGSDQASA
jgi:methylamine dehydrogenase accessory protein MauD